MSVQYKVKKVNNMKYVIKKSMHYKNVLADVRIFSSHCDVN